MAVGETSRLKQLIAVAQEGSSDRRRDLLREITDVFMAAPDRYTSSEMQHFDVIMSKVTESVEVSLRREISEKLADVPEAPRGLVRQLAHDDVSVAEPILKRSQALTEEDLIRVIRQRGQGHMKAITERREVPENVSSELVERGDKEVLVSLAKNRGAKLNNDSMEKLVEHSRSISELQAPMANRYDLPPQLLTQMYFFVSSALKKEILRRSDLLDPAIIDEAVNANRTKILSTAVTEAQSEVDSAQKFVRDRINSNTLNESLLKELIEIRRTTEFLLAFSHYIGVDTSTAQRIMKDRSWESLAISCRAAGLERSTFAKIVFGLQKSPEEQTKALRILDLYLKIPQEAAERVMRFWRVRAQSAGAEEKRKKKSPIYAAGDQKKAAAAR
ncbi:MAG: DUF2336 domain-containing protein [Pseudomonadota bacterium]